MRTLMVLKIGGSVLTDKKSRTPELREEKLMELGRSLRTLWPKPLIIVHGAGAYGHPLAREYDLNAGYKDPRSLEGFVRTSCSSEDAEQQGRRDTQRGWASMHRYSCRASL